MRGKKLRALTLAVLMITSVFAGVVALSGSAAAANEANIDADNTPSTEFSPNSEGVLVADVSYTDEDGLENVSVDLGGGNNSSDVAASEFDSVTLTLDYNGETKNWTTSYDALTETFEFNSTYDNVTNVRLEANPSGSADSGTVVDVAYEFNSSTVSSYDTSGTQAVTTETGFISGRVSDTNNNDIENATVSVSQNGTVVKTTQTNTQGEYTVELAPGTYNLKVEKTDFSTAQAKDLTVEANKTTTANLVIRKLEFPVAMDVVDVSPDNSVLRNNQIDITVEVTTNKGNLAETDVAASSNNPDITFVSPSTIYTGTDGKATFTVTSDDVASGIISFEVVENTSVTAIQTVEFTPLAGDGTIPGEVKTGPDNESLSDLPGADVWTVRQERFNSNTRFATADIPAGTMASLRLVDTSTGETVDNDMYRVQIDEPASAASVMKAEVFNQSAVGIGSGFYATDSNGDGFVSVAVTPIAPGNYTLEVAPSDSPAGPSDFTFVRYVDVENDLSYEATKDRSMKSDARLWDETDAFGEYGLNNLYTDKQEGINYVVIAHEPGYSTDFADTFQWSDGYYFDDANKKDIIMTLEPEKVEPGYVEIVNWGIRQDDGTVEAFDNMSSPYPQKVPRDGSEDVINVTVRSDENGAYVNGTVTLEVPDEDALGPEYNFTGEFIEVIGGEKTSTGNDTVTIVTKLPSEDARSEAAGTAQVVLKTDRSGKTLKDLDDDPFTGVTAELGNAPSVTHRTNKSFVGVLSIDAASMSGLTTDGDNNPVQSTVYVKSMEFGPTEFEIARNDNGTFTITRTSAANNPSEVVTQSDMESYTFEKFTDVSLAPGVEGLMLLTESSADGEYTLDRVPATTDIASYIAVKGAVLSDVDGDGDLDISADGTSVSTFVEPDRTSAANIRIPAAAGADLNVVSLSPQDPTVQEGATITVNANITNDGDVTATQTVEFRVAGQIVATETVTVVGGVTEPVSFTTTVNLPPGSYQHGVFTADNSATGTLTVEASNPLSRFDQDDSGQIGFQEVIDAIEAYNTDGQIGGEDVEFQDVLDAIEAYNNDTQV